MPGPAMSTGSNSMASDFRIMKIRCWCVTICKKENGNDVGYWMFLYQ